MKLYSLDRSVNDKFVGINFNDIHICIYADVGTVANHIGVKKNHLQYQNTRTALINYRALHGHMLVPSIFLVPTDDISWPIETWGMKLGFVVNNIRGGNSYVDKREDLESIGFNYESQSRSHGYELVQVALRTYKELNGDMLVSQIFLVPTDDISWPKET
jgi:hypothetical protein